MTDVAGMKHSKTATIIWVAVLVLWICFIWGHSLMSGPESAEESGFFVNLFSPVFDLFKVSDPDVRGLIVRKFAHFSEHAVLAILATGAMRRLFAGKRHWWVFALLICVAVPSLDETIQIFTPGRGPALTDVCIDLAGCAAGALLAWLVRYSAARKADKSSS